MSADQNLTVQDSRDEAPEVFENPGLPPHRPRLGDEDPKANKRSERLVGLIFGISLLASVASIIGYFFYPLHDNPSLGDVRMANLILGLGIAIGALGIGVAAVHWAKSLMHDGEMVEERKDMQSSVETRTQAMDMIKAGIAESSIARRPVLKGTLIGALALAPLPFLVSLLGNLGGDWDVSKLKRTVWKPVDGGDPENYYQGRYRYLALDPQGRKIKASDITNDNIVHVMPAGLADDPNYLEEKAKAVVLLIRVEPEALIEPEEKKDWSYQGIVAYSKICTHVGCPVALYERNTHHLLCPCHQSTFDVLDQAKVVFGPAKRALPQLPIAVDEEGYLYAQADFDEPVGPSFWERER